MGIVVAGGAITVLGGAGMAGAVTGADVGGTKVGGASIFGAVMTLRYASPTKPNWDAPFPLTRSLPCVEMPAVRPVADCLGLVNRLSFGAGMLDGFYGQ